MKHPVPSYSPEQREEEDRWLNEDSSSEDSGDSNDKHNQTPESEEKHNHEPAPSSTSVQSNTSNPQRQAKEAGDAHDEFEELFDEELAKLKTLRPPLVESILSRMSTQARELITSKGDHSPENKKLRVKAETPHHGKMEQPISVTDKNTNKNLEKFFDVYRMPSCAEKHARIILLLLHFITSHKNKFLVSEATKTQLWENARGRNYIQINEQSIQIYYQKMRDALEHDKKFGIVEKDAGILEEVFDYLANEFELDDDKREKLIEYMERIINKLCFIDVNEGSITDYKKNNFIQYKKIAASIVAMINEDPAKHYNQISTAIALLKFKVPEIISKPTREKQNNPEDLSNADATPSSISTEKSKKIKDAKDELLNLKSTVLTAYHSTYTDLKVDISKQLQALDSILEAINQLHGEEDISNAELISGIFGTLSIELEQTAQTASNPATILDRKDEIISILTKFSNFYQTQRLYDKPDEAIIKNFTTIVNDLLKAYKATTDKKDIILAISEIKGLLKRLQGCEALCNELYTVETQFLREVYALSNSIYDELEYTNTRPDETQLEKILNTLATFKDTTLAATEFTKRELNLFASNDAKKNNVTTINKLQEVLLRNIFKKLENLRVSIATQKDVQTQGLLLNNYVTFLKLATCYLDKNHPYAKAVPDLSVALISQILSIKNSDSPALRAEPIRQILGPLFQFEQLLQASRAKCAYGLDNPQDLNSGYALHLCMTQVIDYLLPLRLITTTQGGVIDNAYSFFSNKVNAALQKAIEIINTIDTQPINDIDNSLEKVKLLIKSLPSKLAGDFTQQLNDTIQSKYQILIEETNTNSIQTINNQFNSKPFNEDDIKGTVDRILDIYKKHRLLNELGCLEDENLLKIGNDSINELGESLSQQFFQGISDIDNDVLERLSKFELLAPLDEYLPSKPVAKYMQRFKLFLDKANQDILKQTEKLLANKNLGELITLLKKNYHTLDALHPILKQRISQGVEARLRTLNGEIPPTQITNLQKWQDLLANIDNLIEMDLLTITVIFQIQSIKKKLPNAVVWLNEKVEAAGKTIDRFDLQTAQTYFNTLTCALETMTTCKPQNADKLVNELKEKAIKKVTETLLAYQHPLSHLFLESRSTTKSFKSTFGELLTKLANQTEKKYVRCTVAGFCKQVVQFPYIEGTTLWKATKEIFLKNLNEEFIRISTEYSKNINDKINAVERLARLIGTFDTDKKTPSNFQQAVSTQFTAQLVSIQTEITSGKKEIEDIRNLATMTSNLQSAIKLSLDENVLKISTDYIRESINAFTDNLENDVKQAVTDETIMRFNNYNHLIISLLSTNKSTKLGTLGNEFKTTVQTIFNEYAVNQHDKINKLIRQYEANQVNFATNVIDELTPLIKIITLDTTKNHLVSSDFKQTLNNLFTEITAKLTKNAYNLREGRQSLNAQLLLSAHQFAKDWNKITHLLKDLTTNPATLLLSKQQSEASVLSNTQAFITQTIADIQNTLNTENLEITSNPNFEARVTCFRKIHNKIDMLDKLSNSDFNTQQNINWIEQINVYRNNLVSKIKTIFYKPHKEFTTDERETFDTYCMELEALHQVFPAETNDLEKTINDYIIKTHDTNNGTFTFFKAATPAGAVCTQIESNRAKIAD